MKLNRTNAVPSDENAVHEVGKGAAGKGEARARTFGIRNINTNFKKPDALPPKRPSQEGEKKIRKGEKKTCVFYRTEDYLNDINAYLLHIEPSFLLDESYMVGKKINARQRNTLLDWIVQVVSRFDLMQETLHLSVYLTDRYLEQKMVTKAELQLAGITALYVACKYEEKYMPPLEDFEYVCDESITRKDMFDMELDLLRRCSVRLGKPNALHFMRIYTTAISLPSETHCLSKYLNETCMMDPYYSTVAASRHAAGSVWLAARLHRLKGCNFQKAFALLGEDGVAIAEVEGKRISKVFIRLVTTGSAETVMNKYASSKYHRVSTLTKDDELILREVAWGKRAPDGKP